MRQFIFASLLCFCFTHVHGVYQAPTNSNEPLPLPKEEDQGEVAGPDNAYEYNLYDRQENRRDQQQRQQYFYYQNQNQQQYQQQQNAPQYSRKKQPLHSQYFDPRNE